MNRLPIRRQTSLLAAGLLSASFAMSACGASSDAGAPPQSRRTVAISAPDFATVQDLAQNSAIYVRGRIGGVISRETDDGGIKGGDAAVAELPVMFVELSVTQSSDETLVPAGATVPIIWSDSGPNVQSEQTSTLVEGSEVLVFAEPLSSQDAPGIETVKFFLVPTGGQNGVFDVTSGMASARSPMLASLSSAGDKQSGTFKSEVADITTVADVELR